MLLACLAALGGCADSLEPKQPNSPGVTGRMLALDDTGLPPTALGGGGILVIPEAALPDLWPRVGMGKPERPEELAYTGFPTDRGLVTALGGEAVPVDDDGHFRLTVAGPHVICHLPAKRTAGLLPAFASGCDLVDLPVSAALTAFYGEGGFHADVEKSSASTGH